LFEDGDGKEFCSGMLGARGYPGLWQQVGDPAAEEIQGDKRYVVETVN
jgi:hypothetical protein